MSKGLEALESIIETFYDKESEDIQIVRKELKALEIIKHFIKSKSLGLTFIFLDDDKKILIVDGYDFECFYICNTQEEYDLLKEVLL